jgi:hypothetical protein
LGVTTTGNMPIAAQCAAIDHFSTVWTRDHAFGHKSRFKATNSTDTTVGMVHNAVAACTFGSRHGRSQRIVVRCNLIDQGHFGHNCVSIQSVRRIQIGLVIYRRLHACSRQGDDAKYHCSLLYGRLVDCQSAPDAPFSSLPIG